MPDDRSSKRSSPGLLLVPYAVAFFVRRLLMSEAAQFSLQERPELATPVNSYKRLVEGAALHNSGVDPYAGAIFHETPLFLAAFNFVAGRLGNSAVVALFIVVDLFTARLLGRIGRAMAERLQAEEARNSKKYHEDASDLKLEQNAGHFMELYTQLAYLFSPFVIASCAARTTTVFSNFFIALFILSMLRRRYVFACLFLAVETYHNLYPVMLISPLVLSVLEASSDCSKQSASKSAAGVVFMFVAFLLLMLAGSYQLMGGSASFLWSVYGFILTVPELTPNMGLFWYFFTEMFEHFRLFFVCTFQLNVFAYVVPLSIRFKKDPFILTFALLALVAIFKSYPSYGDVGLYLALLPLFRHVIPFTKQLFIVATMFLATSVLGPILHHLWIYNSSANANYFFAINLVFGTAQIFLVTDLLFAYAKREFYLFNGYKRVRAGLNNAMGPRLVLK